MRPDQPVWIHPDQVEQLNHLVVAQTGERFLLRDRSLLEGAVARAENLWAYEEVDDLVTLAARLIVGIGSNHPFEQGNKRTALLAGLSFLFDNGLLCRPPNTDEAGDLVEAAIIGDLPESDLIAFLRQHLAS